MRQIGMRGANRGLSLRAVLLGAALMAIVLGLMATVPSPAKAEVSAIEGPEIVKPEAVGGTVYVKDGAIVQFEAEGEPSPSCEPIEFKWEFVGEGVVEEEGFESTFKPEGSCRYASAVEHTFASPGSHEVRLTATAGSASGQAAPLSVYVGEPLQMSLRPSQEDPLIGEQVSFAAQQTGLYVPPVTYEFLLGSNLAEATLAKKVTGEGAATYQTSFSSLGSHTVFVKAEDSGTGTEARSGTAEAHVQVVPKMGGSIHASSADPLTGEALSLIAGPSGGLPPYSYSWTVDGKAAPGSGPSIPVAFSAAGAHSFSVVVSDSAHPAHTETLTGGVTVDQPLKASLSYKPSEEVDTGTKVTFTASASGGRAPLTYSWQVGSGAPVSTGASPTFQHAFAKAGRETVSVHVRDALGRTITQSASLEVLRSCEHTVAFGLIEAKTSGCLRRHVKKGQKSWSTEDATKVNGIPLHPVKGHPLVIDAPTKKHPGGKIAIGHISIKLGKLTVFKGDISWGLPAGHKGQEKQVASLKVPAKQKIFGLQVGGSVGLDLGYSAKGEHYASFPLQISLPSIFKSGPDSESGGVSAAAAIKVDESGVHYGGMRLQVKKAWIGDLKVESVCLSFVPAGSQGIKPCPAPSLDGKPYISCKEDPGANRWDGNAEIVLPTGSGTKLAVFGGLANGHISKLGGFVDELGDSVPIADGVYLNRVGVGLCINPPPFKLRGDVGVSVLPLPDSPPTVAINGHFLFTNAYKGKPWSIELGGNVKVYGDQVGEGDVIIRPTGYINFGLNAGIELAKIVSIKGHVTGWLETQYKRFDVEGGVKACIPGKCASATAVVSSTGLAGCLDLGTIKWSTAVKDNNWKWWAPWRVHWVKHSKKLQAGFGHKWSEKGVRLFAASCDFGPYQAKVASLYGFTAGMPRGFTIAKGTQAIAVKIDGAGGPPNVVIHGPDGTRIASPAQGGGFESPGHYLIAENPSDGSTDVLLIKPAAGRWSVEAQPGQTITGITSAPYAQPATGTGVVRRATHGKRMLAASFALPEGASMHLVEMGREVEHTIRKATKGKSCGHGPSRPGGEQLRCLRLRFRPSQGPAGRRHIVGFVTRAGVPLGKVRLASFHASAERRPSRPKLQIGRRHHNRVQIAWKHARRAASYTVSVHVSNGKKLSFNPGPLCRRLVLRGVTRRDTVKVKIAGLRSDLIAGRYAHVKLKAKHRRAGAHGHFAGPICH